jgi:transposase
MPAERLSMRKVREVLHLKHALGMSYRRISSATGASKTQAADYVRRAALVGITWPIPAGLDDAELERRLFAADAGASERRAIDWAAIQRELKRRGVTLALLWQEYLADHPNGYSYTRFCELYAAWRKQVSPTMRQTHLAGEKLFVDWAGDTIAVVDPASGTERRAHIFVAALGASNFTYAEARWSETLPVHALAAIGGVPRVR